MNNDKSLARQLTLKRGLVFYDRLNKDDAFQAAYWKKIYQSSMREFESNMQVFNNYTHFQVGQTLIRRGELEQQKELNFLKTIYGYSQGKLDWEEYPKYINTINQIVGMKDDYENLLKLIKKKSVGKERAPIAFAYLDSYLTTTLTENLRQFFSTKKAEEIMNLLDNVRWQTEFDKIYEKSLKEAILKISEQVEIIENEEVQIWKNISNLLDKTETFFDEIKSLIYTRYNLESASNQIFEWEKERRAKNRIGTRGLNKAVASSYGIKEIEKRSIAGLVQEYATHAFKDKIEINEKGAVFPSNVMRADAVKVYSADININLDKLVDTLKLNSLESRNLIDAEKILDNFNQNFMSGLDDTFVVYENTKAYSMGSSFRGFGSGGSKPLNSLPEYLDGMGVNINGHEIVELLYNTAKETIGDGRREEVKEKSSLLLSQYLANFMFDDWASIGNTSNTNAIHMFNLNGVLVPLSYLLIATGKAIETLNVNNSYFKISFKVHDEIKWPNRIEPWEEKRGMLSYWEEQKEIFDKKSSFNVKFMSNFKNLITQLLKTL